MRFLAARSRCFLPSLLERCKEEGGVKVSSFTFNGTKAVTASQLKSVLATSASSKIPWGEKHYFSREQFEADLKRIVAFYKDRGFPDARVTSFDAKLNDAQTSVSITVNIDEGEPVRSSASTSPGSTRCRSSTAQTLEAQLPLKVGQPLDRALLQASREAALDELKDHGYPYASVRIARGGRAATIASVSCRSRPTPAPSRASGRLRSAATRSVSDNVVRRQLTYRPGPAVPPERAAGEPAKALWPGALRLRERRTAEDRREAAGCADAGHRHRGQASEGQLRRRLRDGREGARRGRLAPRQLLRRRADRPACWHATRDSIAASGSISRSPTSSAPVRRSR